MAVCSGERENTIAIAVVSASAANSRFVRSSGGILGSSLARTQPIRVASVMTMLPGSSDAKPQRLAIG